ncbi:MAG: sigma-70 family RNA polymerase sigma factor [Kiritimatiellaeota bacterium]|nr:sigma-70 family RNA polymerase sigma factor [Kiritimatiellota bacterium]
MSENGTDQDQAEGARRRQIEAVVREYQQPLLRYAARLLRNPTLAQDVVQGVFVKLVRQWQPSQCAGPALRPWLFRVTHNEAVDLIRAEEARRRLHERGAEEAAAACADAHADGAAAAERHALVLASLDALTPGERQVVLLRLQQGMSYDEIAAVTSRPRSTVGVMLHQAVRKLSEKLRGKETP